MLFGLRRKLGCGVVLERRGSALLVFAGGSVDASNVDVWQRLIGEAGRTAAAPGSLIIDTNGLEFMGVCAFVALAQESAACRRRGIRLCLVSSQRIAGTVVTAAGLDTELSLFASVDAALAPLSTPERQQ